MNDEHIRVLGLNFDRLPVPLAPADACALAGRPPGIDRSTGIDKQISKGFQHESCATYLLRLRTFLFVGGFVSIDS